MSDQKTLRSLYAQEALQAAKDALSRCILSSIDGKAQVDAEQWNTLVREDIAEIDRALAGTPAPVASPATCPCGESACAGPGDGANHQCGGPAEACGIAGCRECGTPDPVQDAFTECTQIVNKLYEESADGRISRSELIAEIETAASRAGQRDAVGGK